MTMLHIVPYPPSYAIRYPGNVKSCSKCNTVKPFSDFGQLQNGRLRPACQDCKNQAGREYKARNADKVKASNAEYRASNKEAQAARVAKCRTSRIEHYRAVQRKWKAENRTPAKHSEENKRHYYRNHEKSVADVIRRTHIRRVHIRTNCGTYTAAEWEAQKARQNYRCLMCGKPEPEIKLTIDHVIPIIKGGDNTIGNLQGLCKPCNSSKKDKILDLR